MATMRDVVDRSARMLGIVKAGRQAAGNDAEDLLQKMQSVIDRLPNYRNGPWTDHLLGSADDYTAKDGQRISPQGFDPVITLPTTFTRCDADTDIQNDLSRVHVIGDGFYIWSSSLGAWNKADSLALNDTFPFGSEDEDGIAAMTAVYAAPEYGADITAATSQQASIAVASLRSRFYRDRSKIHRCRFGDYV